MGQEKKMGKSRTAVEQITSGSEDFVKHLSKAKQIVDEWPSWKRNSATSYPRREIEKNTGMGSRD